jgi:hypothetical protein
MTLVGPVARRLVLGLDAPYYFSVHARPDDAPPFRAHALRYLTPGERGADFEGALEAWARRVVPGLEAHVAARRFLPEMEVASTLPPLDAGARVAPEFERISFVGEWAFGRRLLFDAVAESVHAAVLRVRARIARPMGAAA